MPLLSEKRPYHVTRQDDLRRQAPLLYQAGQGGQACGSEQGRSHPGEQSKSQSRRETVDERNRRKEAQKAQRAFLRLLGFFAAH